MPLAEGVPFRVGLSLSTKENLIPFDLMVFSFDFHSDRVDNKQSI